MEAELYKGRKGRRKLKAVEKRIDSINGEFNTAYEESSEFVYLTQEVQWEPGARLVFALACRNVNFRWNGILDYGFLRLCTQWIKTRKLQIVDETGAVQMMKDILPEKVWQELGDEINNEKNYR